MSIPVGARTSALILEHEALGAEFAPFDLLYLPTSYRGEADVTDGAVRTVVSDVTDVSMLRVSGADATRFLETMGSLAVGDVEVGRTSASVHLTGEGEIIDLVTVARTSDDEYFLLGTPENREELLAWLQAHATLADGETPVFPDVELLDTTALMSAIVLMGPASADIISEMSGSRPEDLAGRVMDITLDGRPALLVSAEEALLPARWLLYLAKDDVTTIWRGILSFEEIDPIGREALVRLLYSLHPELKALTGDAYLLARDIDLGSVVDPGRRFVGSSNLRP